MSVCSRLPEVCESLVCGAPCVILCLGAAVAHGGVDGASPTQGSPVQCSVIRGRVTEEAGGRRPRKALLLAPLQSPQRLPSCSFGFCGAVCLQLDICFALPLSWLAATGALLGCSPRPPCVAWGFSMEGAPPRLSSRVKPLHRSEWPSILPTSMLCILVCMLPTGARAHPLLQLEPQALTLPCPYQGLFLEMRTSFEQCLHQGVGAFRWGEARHPGPPNVFSIFIVNPSGLNGKAGYMASLPTALFAISETQLSRHGISQFRRGLAFANRGLRWLPGAPRQSAPLRVLLVTSRGLGSSRRCRSELCPAPGLKKSGKPLASRRHAFTLNPRGCRVQSFTVLPVKKKALRASSRRQ